MSNVNNSLYKWLLIHCDSFWWLNYSGDLQKILKEMRIPNCLNCHLRNLYTAQDATTRTRHGTMYWFKIRKGVCQSWILALRLLNLHADYTQNAGFHEAQAGIKIQFCSFTQLCPMSCSMPGLPVHLQLPEPTQTHVHRVGDAIQPSHPLSSRFPPAFNLSQHQGLFQWVSSSHEVAKVLEFQLQHQSFQWTPRVDLL